MGIISLVSGLESSVIIRGNGGEGDTKKMDEEESESSESESDNPSSSTSSSSSDSDGSSSDDDDVEDDEEAGQQEKREVHTENNEVEVEEGEIKDYNGQELVTETAVNDDDDDDDDDMEIGLTPELSKLPQNLPPVPPVNVTLGPHHQMLPVGVVMSIINTQVIVEGVEKHDPLSEGSILWITESRTPLGLVDEIFGPVKNPYYIVRYNSENEVPISIHGGTSVSFVPEFAKYVLNNKDLYKKGYDKSGFDDDVSDEEEFSDDEKEAECMKQKMKIGISDQNPQKQKIYKRKGSQKRGAGGPYPVRPTAPSPDDRNFSTFSGIRRGPSGATSMVPPFPPTSADRNLASTGGVWTNGVPLQQPQSALLPSGLPPNGIPWFPGNVQNPYQLPMSGMPFQQQLGPSLGSLPTTMFPGVQPNIFAQPTYPLGHVGQNQMTFGLNSHIPQLQPPPVFAGGQGSIPDHQSRIGASPNYGRQNFYRGGREGWRP
ncbi:H/ACA ribonucleoprotein complex non-core subunit NAF1 [Senna tora]|uniref:H/ACA ribonucleoprotein complex non-core subunit NAF1 n=1 Tax=Senna tora TaxID=362788 RepID=A0A834SKB2_9FABA|nr:H/ACA ribonucleoprotein complex non-core subunit NAF1 [Senna tora]